MVTVTKTLISWELASITGSKTHYFLNIFTAVENYLEVSVIRSYTSTEGRLHIIVLIHYNFYLFSIQYTYLHITFKKTGSM